MAPIIKDSRELKYPGGKIKLGTKYYCVLWPKAVRCEFEYEFKRPKTRDKFLSQITPSLIRREYILRYDSYHRDKSINLSPVTDSLTTFNVLRKLCKIPAEEFWKQ